MQFPPIDLLVTSSHATRLWVRSSCPLNNYLVPTSMFLARRQQDLRGKKQPNLIIALCQNLLHAPSGQSNWAAMAEGC